MWPRKDCGPCENCRPASSRSLFGFLLLLLTDAHLEVQNFGLLESLVVMPGNGIGQISIHVGVLGEHCHQGEAFVTGRAERPETLHVGDCCHNFFILADSPAPARVPGTETQSPRSAPPSAA